MQGNSKKNNNQSIVEILNERLTKLTTASIFTFQTGNFSILHREMYATQQRIKNFFDNKVAPLNIPNQNAQTNTKAHETAST